MSTETSVKVYDFFKKDIGQRGLSDDEQLILFKAAQDGDLSALNRLIKDNAPLVIKIAWRYTNSDKPWADINDLIQEGCEGLIRAIEKFDPAKGKFSDYAGHWIRQRITMYLAKNSNIISLPRKVYDLVLKWHRLSTLFQDKYGHYPDTPSDSGFNEDESRIIKRAEQSMLKHNFDINDDAYIDDVAYIYYIQIREGFEKDISSLLTEAEAEVIILRWLGPNGPQTQLEISKVLGISKQAVGDREKRALRKLRKGMKGYE